MRMSVNPTIIINECVVGRLGTGESPGPGDAGEAAGGAREVPARRAGEVAAKIQEGEARQVPGQLEGQEVVAVRPGGQYYYATMFIVWFALGAINN